MLVHKGGQINNVQLITWAVSAEMSYLQNCSVKIFKEHCSRKKEKKWGVGGHLRFKDIIQLKKGVDLNPKHSQVT